MDPDFFRRIEKGLDEGEHFAHPLTLALVEDGFTVNPERLSDHAQSMLLGLRFQVGTSEIVYRLVDAQTLVVVLFRRIRPAPGLMSPFKDIVWFAEYVIRLDLGIKYALGRIKPPMNAQGGLPAPRIAAFYKKYLGAETLGWHDHVEWVVLDLDRFTTPRRLRIDRVHSAGFFSNN